MMILTTQLDASTHDSGTLDEALAWQQLLARDNSADFFYGVTTTGVFCRPGCSSRRPLRANTRFFSTGTEAQAAGFRPCMRCKPGEPRAASSVARMCAYLELHLDEAVRLSTLGKLAGISPFTAQRIFKKEMGATPAQYQRAMRARALRSELKKGQDDVTTAIYAAGYGSASRAYEQSSLGMTPSRFLAGGRGESIRFAVAESQVSPALGWMIIGSTERGICWLALAASANQAKESLRDEFPAATLVEDEALAATLVSILKQVHGAKESTHLSLDLRGTAFQLKVWQALQEIPAGETRTYSQLAADMGMPKSTRAVARACALNRVSVLVPCHRVVGISGSLTGYRWGIDRKRQLLTNEGARLA